MVGGADLQFLVLFPMWDDQRSDEAKEDLSCHSFPLGCAICNLLYLQHNFIKLLWEKGQREERVSDDDDYDVSIVVGRLKRGY